MADSSIKLSITGKLTYSEEITISQAAEIISFLNADDVSATSNRTGSGLGGPKNQTDAKVASAREAIEISGAAKNPEKIVALGAYVLQDGGETFKAEDVKGQFRRARESAPGNFSRDLSTAISSGWIAEDQPGEYFLTNKVEGIFDGGFTFTAGTGSSGGGRNRTSRKSKNGPRAKSAKPDTLESIDEFHGTMSGFHSYSKMKAEKDRLLWIVTYMRDTHARKTVTNKEIAWVSDHIGTGISSNNIAGAFNSAKRAGLAVRSTQDNSIKVTDDGVAHLKSLASES